MAQPGLYLLFETGRRPARSALPAAIEQIPRAFVSWLPDLGKDRGGAADWAELLLDGLTFDLLGFAPAPALRLPPLVHPFGMPPGFRAETCQPLALVPGPHIAAGAGALPVVRAMMALGAGLVRAFDGVVALGWSPARALIEPAIFLRMVESWLAGGPFPALGLSAFVRDPQGRLASEGLSFYIGQELRLDLALSADPVAATRLAARLIHELVAGGPLVGDAARAMEDGRLLSLRVAADDPIIEVTLA